MDARRRRLVRLAGLGAFSILGGGALAATRWLFDDPGDRPAPSTGTGPSAPRAVSSSTASEDPTTTTGTAPDDSPDESPDEPSQAASSEGGAALVTLLCREAWGADPPTRSVPRHTVRRLMVHHTAVVLSDNRDAPRRVRSHQAFHQREGFADLAYHVVIDANGNVYEGRDPATPGETFTDYDPEGWFLIACEGSFDEQPLPAAQRDALERTLAWASAEFGVDPQTIAAHRDESATSCPGDAIYRLFQDGSLVRGVQHRISTAAGSATVAESCGPEAQDRIARIEAGGA